MTQFFVTTVPQHYVLDPCVYDGWDQLVKSRKTPETRSYHVFMTVGSVNLYQLLKKP